MAEWLGHRDPRITHQTYAHVMPDAPERLRLLMDAVFTMETELHLPLEFESVLESNWHREHVVARPTASRHDAFRLSRARGARWVAVRPVASE